MAVTRRAALAYKIAAQHLGPYFAFLFEQFLKKIRLPFLQQKLFIQL
jgi:hypothetical protein